MEDEGIHTTKSLTIQTRQYIVDDYMSSKQSIEGRVKVGDHAPDFTLPNQSGEMIHLEDFVGKKIIVLYFYPKDFSSGCTAEACAFRDSYEVFKEAGAEVMGEFAVCGLPQKIRFD